MMKKNYLIVEESESIIDSMIDTAAGKLAEITGEPIQDCSMDIGDYVNSCDWMLWEEDEDGNTVIDADYFSKFLEKAIDYCLSLRDNYTREEKNTMFEISVNVPDYDPELSHNGGSYYQPSFIAVKEDGSKYTLDDTSCGDFGERWDLHYTSASGEEIHLRVDEIGDIAYSDFPSSFKAELETLSDEIYSAHGDRYSFWTIDEEGK